ncbi:hypothetical protein LWC34_54420 [Kibdelosporangium philippinense]|uniref:Uncharacterized protein n=1 Tax=Kibdelosporangium philippinense TaxID=211113 RepID=A0ABS8ZVZ4_9PSEU|nr:hypothetical protein [Kibdelosporangium philippinense]MCE7011754.1 hypothetical protein [Kibdelosporangium philippinense]
MGVWVSPAGDGRVEQGVQVGGVERVDLYLDQVPVGGGEGGRVGVGGLAGASAGDRDADAFGGGCDLVGGGR